MRHKMIVLFTTRDERFCSPTAPRKNYLLATYDESSFWDNTSRKCLRVMSFLWWQKGFFLTIMVQQNCRAPVFDVVFELPILHYQPHGARQLNLTRSNSNCVVSIRLLVASSVC